MNNKLHKTTKNNKQDCHQVFIMSLPLFAYIGRRPTHNLPSQQQQLNWLFARFSNVNKPKQKLDPVPKTRRSAFLTKISPSYRTVPFRIRDCIALLISAVFFTGIYSKFFTEFGSLFSTTLLGETRIYYNLITTLGFLTIL